MEQVSRGYWETFAQIIAYAPPHEERLEPQMPAVGKCDAEVVP